MFIKILIGLSLLIIVGLLIGCSGFKQETMLAAKAQENTLLNEKNTATTTAEENEALVRRYYETVNRGDVNALNEFFAPDYKRYLSAAARSLGATAQKHRLKELFIAFPNLQLTVDNIIAEGDRVSVSLTVRGKHQGTLMDIDPTGIIVEVFAFEVIRIENGKFAEHWGGSDNLDLAMQLGAVLVTQSELLDLKTQLNTASAEKSQTDANKALVVRYFEAQAKGDADALAQIFAPDYKRYISAAAPPLDAGAQMQRLAGLRAAFPDLQITVDNVIAGGDHVAFKLTARGTHQGELMGIGPTGKSITVSAFEFIRIEDGKFVEHWGGPDTFDMLQQLGAVVSPPVQS